MTDHTVFVELDLEGNTERATGFVEGFRLAGTDPAAVFLSEREPIEAEGLIDSIRERVGRRTRVILSKRLAERMVAALAEAPRLELAAHQPREIDYAELAFEFRVFDRDDAKQVRHLIEDELPAGVRLDDYHVDEKIEEDAKGVELYSPVHDYILSGSGTYVGAVDGVLEVAHRLDQQDFVHPKRVRLHHRR
jgi:hypothetical protein